MSDALRPYLSVLSGRFQLTLQYRAAAIAGFATQCWWGALKIMVYAAFYAGAVVAAPMPLADVITYTWLGQAFLVFLPWQGDPDVGEMVRTGSVAYERLRPIDTYAWWYAKLAAWSAARAAPRAVLMALTAAVILPLVGLGEWSLRGPASGEAAALFAVSMAAMVLLATSMMVLLNILIVVTMNDRGPNILAAPLANVLSGSIVPLAFFPAPIAEALRLQPFAGLVDTPFRIYFGDLAGWGALGGVGLQLGWTAVLVLLGRWALGTAMNRLQVQGG